MQNSDPFAPGSSRVITSPVTTAQLEPLAPHCRVVVIEGPLSDEEHRRVAGFLRAYPRKRVCLSDRESLEITFLKHYLFISHLRIDLWSLRDFEGLELVADGLEILELAGKKSRSLSLKFLGRCRRVKGLMIEGEHRDFAAIQSLKRLEDLELLSVPLLNLKDLEALAGLKRLHIGLGGTKDLSSLPNIGALEDLGLWRVTGLSDISMIGRIESLSSLSLRELRQVTSLPSFQRLQKLKRLDLYCMKGLHDLSPIRQACNLEELLVTNCDQFSVEDFRPLAGMDKLRHGLVGIGSLKRDDEVKAMLKLEKPKQRIP